MNILYSNAYITQVLGVNTSAIYRVSERGKLQIGYNARGPIMKYQEVLIDVDVLSFSSCEI